MPDIPAYTVQKSGRAASNYHGPPRKGHVPLAQAAAIEDLDPRFVKAVRLIFQVLSKNTQVAAFIEELSYLMDEQAEFYQ